MKSLARRAVAIIVCAALLAAQWPATAWAAAGAAEPNPAVAMKFFLALGVYKDDADPLKTYLGNEQKLTQIGRTMYLSLKSRYNAIEAVESMQPKLDRLRGGGVYTEAKQDGAARAAKLLNEKFGELASAPAGSVEESFYTGALLEAIMTGAAIADAPQGTPYSQIDVGDGYVFRDKDGVAFKMTKNQVTTYSRDLQKNQRQMNLNRPAEVPFIPENGRYSFAMLQYSYHRLKNQEVEYIKATRIDRMIALAELLGKQYPSDLWFNDPTLEADLLRMAEAKTYDHRGETYSVLDIIDGKKVDGVRRGGKFAQRRAYLVGVREAVQRFETDMNRFKASSVITDSSVATMSLNEQNALRWLSLTVVETQLFHVKNQGERVDPTSPDAQAIMQLIDKMSGLTQDQKVALKEQGRRMKERLDKLHMILNKTRQALKKADYAGNLDSIQDALASTQKELGDLSVDYSIYLEAISTTFLAKSQTLKRRSWYNLPGNLYNGVSTTVRGVYKLTPGGTKYAANMRAIEGDSKTASLEKSFTEISILIAGGRREDWVEARNKIMAMNPNATQYTMAGALGGEPAKVNDALRIIASLKANNDRITAVTETNKSLDAATSFVTWSISIALMAPMARATLNGVGKLSTVGLEMIKGGVAAGGVRGAGARVIGRSFVVVGEIAKHSAARLGSLEPSAARVRGVAGENAVAQYLVSSGARSLSVATRQATFIGLSGVIAGGFTVGIHGWDIALNRIGGVNVGGYQVFEPGHTMFSEDLSGTGKAFASGFKGGAWWATESFHPLLGYIGLPSTVFQSTRWSGAMDVIASRGVVGSSRYGLRVMTNGKASIEAAAARGEMGLLERLAAAKPSTGKPALAFGLSMADNVSKYVLFSQVAGYAGRQYGWYVDTNIPFSVPLIGEVTNPETDIERRIKRANNTGNVWFMSPLWLLIPTHAAHGARDAGPYMMTKEGMRQYDASGRTAEYAKAPEGTILKLKPVKPPVSQRLFEARVFGDRPAAEWIVTKQANEIGRLKEVKRIAEEGGITPIELMGVREMKSGEKFGTLPITEEVQKVAYEVATKGFVSEPVKSLEALTIKPGRTVKGWGEITPEIQIEIAKALYRAEVNLGQKLPPELNLKVREVLKDHLQANLPIGLAGKVLREAVVALPKESLKLDKIQKDAIDRILDWEVSTAKDKISYLELTISLRETAVAKLKAGELSPKEAKALTALYDYIITGDKRFNSFNRTEVVKSRADVIFDYLDIKYAERPAMKVLVSQYREQVHAWAKGREGKPADGAAIPEAARATKLEVLVSRLEADLKARVEANPQLIGPSERAALDHALLSVKTSAWVVRDAKGSAIPGWRPKQFVRLMQAFLGEGSHTKAVKSSTGELFATMRAENKGRDKLLSEVDGVERDVTAWIKSREAAPAGKTTPMAPLIEKLELRVKDSTVSLTPKDSAALNGLVETITSFDRQGMHQGILSSGRKGGDVQLFIKAPTSLGKTLLAYEGLLPYLEAEAAASGRKVMFLTFNTKLQAQAEFDFLAFNKLGSEVKFNTYEGLKTMIAEGKGKGLNVVEKYLMLQDEMDAAGQQPALTIGMVSGRVSKLNGQTTAINESNAAVAWGLDRLKTIRVEAAEVQAQRIKKVTAGISDAHVEKGRLGAIKVAADDVMASIGSLKKARGAVEIEVAEVALEKGMGALRRLVSDGGLPASQAEAAATILSGLTRMNEALISRPSTNPKVREALAAEMENGFLNQGRLMDLVNTREGLSRLPAAARKATLALEGKIGNLQKSLAEAEASSAPQSARRASLLREQLEFARMEKKMIERFDGVDASSRLIKVDEQIAAIKSGQTPAEVQTVNPKLSRLMSRSLEVDAALAPLGKADAGAMKSYRAETKRVMQLERAIAETEGQITAANKGGKPTEALEARLKQLNSTRESSNSGLTKLETTLNAGETRLAKLTRESLTLETRLEGAASGDAGSLGALRAETSRSLGYTREIGETRTAIKEAKKDSRPTEALEARLTELVAGRETSHAAVRKLETTLGAVKSTPKLEALARESSALESAMTPQRRAAHQEYRALLDKVNTLSDSMGTAPTGGRPALEAARATARGRLRALELELSASSPAGDLGGMLRRINIVSSEAGRLERTGGSKSEIKALRNEEAALRRAARTEIMKRFDDVGTDIVKLTREGNPGWEAQVNRLVERRRALQEAYAGDESAMYTAYRAMKESARPIGTDPRLTEKHYEIHGGDGMEPAAALKRAEFLIERANQVEAKVRGGGMGPLEGQLMLARERLLSLKDKPASSDYFDAYHALLRLETKLLRTDSFYWADRHLVTINGDAFAPLASMKLLWQAFRGTLPAEATGGMGLTRLHAAKMLEALAKDPMMPAHQRDNLMWSYLNSLILPKGIGGRGSYVRSEIINMVHGFHDSAAGVRVDNRTGRFNVVHNGQWFESMDNASRRWWELEYGTDLTLPYTHNSMSTIKDVTTNKKAYFISLSGTAGNKFEAHLRANKISVVGEGSAMPKNVLLELVSTPEQRLSRVVESLTTGRNLTKDQVVLRNTDVIPEGAKADIAAYMTARGMKLNEPQVLKISEVNGAAAQQWLQGIRATQKNTNLIVLSVSDTRALRKVEAELKKAGLEQHEIAKVFADTEYLRLNVPEANVLKQMNIEGLNTGQVKVLILDTRVGGRGLDLNFKGERNSTAPNAFRGYTNFEMLVLGPQEMSAVHMIQAMGRIDTGRTLSRAQRQFSLLMDIQTAKMESVFKNMFDTDPFFNGIRKDPAFQEFTRAHGGKLDWRTLNDYVLRRSADGTGEGQILFQRYEKSVRESLGRRNLEVEENLLRSSSVLTDAPMTMGKNPALERIR